MIDSKSDLYCIFGNPVEHSKSPAMHNAWFEHYKINAVYTAFKIDNIAHAITAMKTLNIKGIILPMPLQQ